MEYHICIIDKRLHVIGRHGLAFTQLKRREWHVCWCLTPQNLKHEMGWKRAVVRRTVVTYKQVIAQSSLSIPCWYEIGEP